MPTAKKIKVNAAKTAKKTPKKAPPRPPLRIYRTISIIFVIIVTLVLGAVIYLSSVEATIYVNSQTVDVESEFLLEVVKAPTQDNEVRGRVLAGAVGRTEAIKIESQGEKVEGVAKGTVTLINDSASAQPLVATTRLWDADQTQFRLKDAVTVPANGSIDAEVYADFEGAEGDIGPSEFTIPGLNATRQKEVYAKSEFSFTGGLSSKNIITQEDIDQNSAALRDALAEEGKELLRNEGGGVFDGESFISTVVSEESSVSAGAETDVFELTMTVKVVGIFYDNDSLDEIAARQLFDRLPEGYEFVDIGDDEMTVIVDRYDADEETATIRVMLAGKGVTSATSEALDPGRFLGMNEAEVLELLQSEEIAESVRIEFKPGFIKTVPRLKDHVIIKIEE